VSFTDVLVIPTRITTADLEKRYTQIKTEKVDEDPEENDEDEWELVKPSDSIFD
jgi:hypothetical protein